MSETTSGNSTDESSAESSSESSSESSVESKEATDREASIRRSTHVFAALVAVTILLIGLFSAPSFQRFLHARQMRKVQQVVYADLNLILTRENEFHAKHQTFTTDLKALTIFPKSVVYKFGFVRASNEKLPELTDHDPSRKDLDALKRALPPDAMIELSTLTKLGEIDFDKLSSYCPDCTATKNSFKAVAAANLDGDPVLDVWTIDEKGQIQHLVDDLSQ